MSQTIKKLKFVGLWIFLIITFLSFASILILEVNGFNFNPKTFKIQKTSLIFLTGDPKQVSLSLNGEVRDINFPIRISKLFPGSYEVKISKENYALWTKNFNLAGGQAVDQKKIILFYLEPKITRIENESLKERIKKDFASGGKKLVLKDNEIWYEEELVTRFSDSISGAILGRDSYHIYFQIKDELRVIELDGTNNILLVKLKKANETQFELSGRKLIYIDDDELFEATIR